MYKILSFLTKRDDISMEQFKDYYENHHIPLVLSLAPGPAVYKRRYLARDGKLGESGIPVDFDVTTEIGFSDQEAFQAWVSKLMGSENGDKVAADEAKFLDRSKSRIYVVDECVTAG